MNRLLISAASWLLRRPLEASQYLHHRPDAPFYAHRGAFSVGTQDFILPDASRPLKLTAWYPAVKGDSEEIACLYTEGPLQVLGWAERNAPFFMEAAPYPLVIFSHGSSGMRWQSLFLTEHLASHGFVVLAVNHTGNTVFDAFLSADKYEELRIRSYIQRPEDGLRMIRFAEETLSALWEKGLDLDRIAVMGHSFGGYTALALGGGRLNPHALKSWCDDPLNQALEQRARGTICYLRHHLELLAEVRGLESLPEGLWEPTTDERIRAVLAFAPWNAPIFGAEGLAQIKLPTLLMVGSEDTVTLPERDAYCVYEQIASADKTLAVFELGGHSLFVDECGELARSLGLFELCSDPVWDMGRAHDLINHLATAFLLAKIYQNADAAQMLHEDYVQFRGLRYQRDFSA